MTVSLLQRSDGLFALAATLRKIPAQPQAADPVPKMEKPQTARWRSQEDSAGVTQARLWLQTFPTLARWEDAALRLPQQSMRAR